MRARLKKTAIIGAALLLIGCAYAFLLSKTGYGIPCVFRLVTGLKCPGCGVSHMLLALFRLDFAAAFNENAALLILLPVLLWLIARWIWSYVRTGSCRGSLFDRVLAAAVVVLLLCWGVLRNIVGI